MLQIITTKIDSKNTYRLSNHRKSVRSKIIIPLQYKCFSLDISKTVDFAINYHGAKCQFPRGTRKHVRVKQPQKSVRSKIIIPLQYNCFSLDIPQNSTLSYKLSWCKKPIAKGNKISHKYVVSEHQLSVSRYIIISYHGKNAIIFILSNKSEMLVAVEDRIDLGNDNDSLN